MKYDFTNTVLYNEFGVYYVVELYDCNKECIYLQQIKKPAADSNCKIIPISDIQDGKLNIVYGMRKK